MRTLFVYPEFPKTFWSYEKILELVNRKVLLPPLGMCTVAALLPQDWEMKLVDRNVREVTEEEWSWAELVIISGMIVQKDDMAVQIGKAKQRGLPVAEVMKTSNSGKPTADVMLCSQRLGLHSSSSRGGNTLTGYIT